jgi:hypothetical protein
MDTRPRLTVFSGMPLVIPVVLAMALVAALAGCERQRPIDTTAPAAVALAGRTLDVLLQ